MLLVILCRRATVRRARRPIRFGTISCLLVITIALVWMFAYVFTLMTMLLCMVTEACLCILKLGLYLMMTWVL